MLCESTPALRADLAEDVDSYRQAWLARARITAEI